MHGVPDLGVLALSNVSKGGVEKLLHLNGGFVFVPPGKYFVGIPRRSFEQQKLLIQQVNCPLYAQSRQVKGFYISRRVVTYEMLDLLLEFGFNGSELTLESRNYGSGAATQPVRSVDPWFAFWSAAALGFRLPSELEWEVALTRSTSIKQRSDFINQSLTFCGKSGTPLPSDEFTSSLGFKRDVRLLGSSKVGNYSPATSMMWSGLIVRGYSREFPNPLSRFSLRTGSPLTTFRLILDEYVVGALSEKPIGRILANASRNAIIKI